MVSEMDSREAMKQESFLFSSPSLLYLPVTYCLLTLFDTCSCSEHVFFLTKLGNYSYKFKTQSPVIMSYPLIHHDVNVKTMFRFQCFTLFR